MARFKCPNCGNEVSSGYNFCAKCGYHLRKISEPIPNPESISEPFPNSIPNPVPQQFDDRYVPDRGIWQMFFQWQGRINPFRFVLRMFFIWTVLPTVILLPLYFVDISNQVAETIFLALFAVIGISTLSMSVRRCHDMNEPAWHVILLFISCLQAVLKAMVRMFYGITGIRIVYFDDDGNYLYTENTGTHAFLMVFAFIQYIVLGIFAVLKLFFTPGTKGENEYGYRPSGFMAQIPKDSNKILAAIQWVEEDATFAQSAGVIFCCCAYFAFLMSLSGNHAQNHNNQASNQPEQSIASTQSATQIDQENISTQEIPQIQPSPVVEQPQHPAIQTFMSFHRNITNRNYSAAYDCLSYDFKSHMAYDGWAQGFRTTISSEAQDIKIYSESSNFIVLTYILKATDNFNGREIVQYFNGTVNLIFENGSWKIDEIVNKVRG